MDILFALLIFVGFFAIYDLIRTLNKSILEQTEEIKKLRNELTQKNKNS